jgi:two-component system chemotaxis sensor kinase CheA
MTELLKGAGYEVTACEDGELALRTLQDAPHQFDILVTDVEMPNLNGFELARRVKDDPGLAHLPIVAVTSLAGDDDVRRGKDAGIDDYQVKLDREALFASIAKYVQVDRRAERCEAAVSR